MKVLISDFKEIMQKNNNVEMKLLKRNHPDWRIAVQSYDLKNPKPFYDELKDADALITAFLPIDQRLLDEAPKLKLISINAVGYEKVNLQLVQKRS